MTIINGDERIAAHEVRIQNDSLQVRLPLYDSEFRGRFTSDTTLQGRWYNHLRGPDYVLPFHAVAGNQHRFPHTLPPIVDISGEWKTLFIGDTCCAATPAIGIFHQDEGRITGTFATETGDYRFLEGTVSGDSLKLSSFNGNQANLFRAVWRNDSLFGSFHSGSHWKDSWVATRDPGFKLRDYDSLTFLKEGYSMIDFRFPNIDGGTVSPRDPDHQGQVLIVQIMGSWCPNCADESQLLEQVHRRYHREGLRILSVAFERYPTEERALNGLKRFREHLGLTYPIAYAGESKKANTSAQLPFLDHVMSFPTTIIIGRDGKVRRIHTGFYGPGTGEYYTAYSRDLDRYVRTLLAEPVLDPVMVSGPPQAHRP